MRATPAIHEHVWPEQQDENGSTECLEGCGNYMEDFPELWGGARTKASALDVLREAHEALDRRDDVDQVKEFVASYLAEIGEL